MQQEINPNKRTTYIGNIKTCTEQLIKIKMYLCEIIVTILLMFKFGNCIFLASVSMFAFTG